MRLLDLLKLDNVEVSLLIVGNSLIRRLNRIYRGIDRATDVLSFPQSDVIHNRQVNKVTLLGDIVINLDRIKVQARQYNVSFKQEIRFMLIHGLLHLLGYDHERDKKSRIKMERLQKRLFNALKKLDNKRQ